MSSAKHTNLTTQRNITIRWHFVVPSSPWNSALLRQTTIYSSSFFILLQFDFFSFFIPYIYNKLFCIHSITLHEWKAPVVTWAMHDPIQKIFAMHTFGRFSLSLPFYPKFLFLSYIGCENNLLSLHYFYILMPIIENRGKEVAFDFILWKILNFFVITNFM